MCMRLCIAPSLLSAGAGHYIYIYVAPGLRTNGPQPSESMIRKPSFGSETDRSRSLSGPLTGAPELVKPLKT